MTRWTYLADSCDTVRDSDTQKEIDRQDMIDPVGLRSAMDELIEVPDFQAESRIGRGRVELPSETQKESVLGETGALSPVCVVEIEEEFVIGCQEEVRSRSKGKRPLDELPKSHAYVITRVQEPLLEPCATGQTEPLEIRRPCQLLPNPVLLAVP